VIQSDVTAGDVCPQAGPAIRIPLHHCRLKPNIPAGLNPLRVMSIADTIRNCGGDIWEPIVVRAIGPDDWLVVDGRHRYVGSYVAGVPDILAVQEVGMGGEGGSGGGGYCGGDGSSGG
jgi:uncharacterized membrane protein YgcG